MRSCALVVATISALLASAASADQPRPNTSGPSSDRNWYGTGLDDMEAALRRGEGRPALAYYERRAEQLAPRRRLAAESAANFNAVIFIAARLGEYQRAIRAGLRSLDVVRDAPHSPQIQNVALNARIRLAGVYRSVGDEAAARRLYEAGLADARAVVNPGERAFWSGNFLQALGAVALRDGDTTTALRLGNESARLLETYIQLNSGAERAEHDGRRNLAGSRRLVADAHHRRGEDAEAERAYRDVLAIANALRARSMEAATLSSLAHLALRRCDDDVAVALFGQARTLAERFDFAPTLIRVHAGLATLHARRARRDDALAAIREAIALVEQLRSRLQESALRSTYLDDRQAVYQQAVRLALDEGRTDEAFGFSERSRARAFLDLLGTHTMLSTGRTSALVAEETRLRARLSEARSMIDVGATAEEIARARRAAEAVEREHREFLERLRKTRPEQAALMVVDPISLAEVQRLLPTGTTLLEYLVTTDETIVWVVDRTTVTVHRLPVGRDAVVSAVEGLRRAIADMAPIETVRDRASATYVQLVAPVRPHIRGDRIVIVPHDVLHYLPFGALRTTDGRWLLEHYTLATVPSAAVLKYLDGKTSGASDRVLAVGNPDVGDALALPYAEREARLVAGQYPAATLLVRREATEARVKALLPMAGIIHFATHGQLNEHDPLASAIRLTPEPPEDGNLEVRELFGLELSARLVVLSACETGLGRLSRGDELVGLQRAFLYAGAPTVITTLWKVDDRSTYELMRAFYSHLAARGVASALREAQRETMRTFPHPFAWAAFGLAGMPR